MMLLLQLQIVGNLALKEEKERYAEGRINFIDYKGTFKKLNEKY